MAQRKGKSPAWYMPRISIREYRDLISETMILFMGAVDIIPSVRGALEGVVEEEVSL